MKNLEYKTKSIETYFSQNRITWKSFYKSEKKIINQINVSKKNSVLDIGCGCGGLGLALKEKFNLIDYTGVEINKQATQKAKQLNKKGTFFCKDLLLLDKKKLNKNNYDFVFSLSCFDWNNNFLKMFLKSWDFVRPGGYLVITLRLTDKIGINNFSKSYQYINYDGKRSGEKARYVILNAKKNFNFYKKLKPSKIISYGYWGSPSSTAVCSYKKLCFTAIAIQKSKNVHDNKIIYNLNLPKNILATLEL